jgi:hypothetical protein
MAGQLRANLGDLIRRKHPDFSLVDLWRGDRVRRVAEDNFESNRPFKAAMQDAVRVPYGSSSQPSR